MFYIGMQVSFTSSVIQNGTNKNTSVKDKGNVSTPAQTKHQNGEFRRITDGQIKDILRYPQFSRSDCYLVSSLKTLAKSGFGKQMLKNSISSNKEGTEFNVEFKRYSENNSYNVNVNNEENEKSYRKVTGRPDLRTIGAVEKATSGLNEDKLTAKPLYLKLFNKYDSGLEGNQASYFMKNLTGVAPISIGDSGFLPLSITNKNSATKLLDKIGEFPINRHSFVAGSKLINTEHVGSSHYYILNKVDNKEKKVYLKDPRYADFSKTGTEEYANACCKSDDRIKTCEDYKEAMDYAKSKPKEICLSYEDFMKDFRSIVGYFDKKVVKDYEE